MKKMKRLYTVLTAMALTAMASFPAMAATETIEDVSLTIDSEVYAEYDDSYVDVEADTEGCYIDSDDVVFTNEPSSGWDEDDTPKIKIVVQADDGYRFKSSKWDNDDIDIDGDGEVTSVTRNSSTKLTIKVTLPAVEYSDDYYDDDDDLEIWDLEWDDDGTAYWEENDYAKRYEVKLYRDGALVKDATKVSDEDYDFSDYFTKKGTYVFKVRGVRSSSEKGRWYESEEWYVSASEAKEIRGESGSSGSSSTGSSSSNSGGSSTGPGAGSTAGAWLKDNVGWWW
ncbi:MAG: hypothetical protein II311_07775, partial [Lachnospiraceae bacterium]|nr:hypothetical protein [Lachnospiraceae bacterium]